MTLKLIDKSSLPNLDKCAGNKFDHGHALVLSGGAGRTGAARLAARAALRTGAGLLTIGVPHEAHVEVACQITSIMMSHIDTPNDLKTMLTDTRINAVCIGPGFGIERAAAFLPAVLAARRATVLDADALTALARDKELRNGLHDRCVLTPHGGDFARLFPYLADRMTAQSADFSKVDATRDAANRLGCTVLFKGHDTVIAAPDGRVSVHSAAYDRAAPWLATAGAGDVLAGIITGLLARGFDQMTATEAGAYLHVECAHVFGPGLIAEDLLEILPTVLASLTQATGFIALYEVYS